MSRVGEEELVTVDGFPLGVNNVTPAEDLPPEEALKSLRAAVNVDLLGPKKRPRLREGYEQLWTGRWHSPEAVNDTLLGVHDGDLVALNEDLTEDTVIRAGVGQRRISWATVSEDRWWSNGQIIRRLRGADLADLPAWIDSAGVPHCDATTGFGLPAGTYRVALTYFNAEGHESGAEGIAELDVPADGGIVVSRFPQPPEGAVRMRLYLSPVNDKELYAAADLVPGVTTTYTLGDSMPAGRALSTYQATVFPPCSILRFWQGLLLGVTGNALRWSISGFPGLTHHKNILRWGVKIPMIEPLGDGTDGAGLYLSDHKNTYWLAGAKPDQFRRIIKVDAPAVRNCSTLVTGKFIGLATHELVAVWLGADGVLYAGLPGGTVEALTDVNKVVMPEGEEGAMLFRQHNGIRQIIASFLTRSTESGAFRLGVRDRVTATVTRHFTP